MPIDATDHRFSVQARHVGPHHARIVAEPSFEAAAVAYVEDLHDLAGAGEAVSVIVRRLSTGEEHCFRIDLDTGEPRPCG
jgi:hypothetical protein